MVCLNIAYTKDIEKMCTVLHKNDIIPIGKRDTKENIRIPAVDKKRQGYKQFPKLSPYYSRYVLPYYLPRAASPQVDGYVYSIHI